jgi:hypothetical protein
MGHLAPSLYALSLGASMDTIGIWRLTAWRSSHTIVASHVKDHYV